MDSTVQQHGLYSTVCCMLARTFRAQKTEMHGRPGVKFTGCTTKDA